MKKNYQKLSMTVVHLDAQQMLTGSKDTISGVVGELDYGGAGSGPARGRSTDGWEDEEEDF